jgi:hypothetical protein
MVPSEDDHVVDGVGISKKSHDAQAAKDRSRRVRRFNAESPVPNTKAGPDGTITNESRNDPCSRPDPAVDDDIDLSHIQLTQPQQRMVDKFKSHVESKMKPVPNFSVELSDWRPKLEVNESVNGWENDTSTFFSNLASKFTDAIRSVYSWMLGSKQSASTLSPELEQSDELDRRSDDLSLLTPSVTTTNRAVVNARKGKPRSKRPRMTSRRKQRKAATARCSTGLRPAPNVCGMKLRKRDRGKTCAAPLMLDQSKALKPSSNDGPHQKRT